MLLAQGQIYAKNMAFCVPIGCVRFVRYCGKMYSRHLFPYGGLRTGWRLNPTRDTQVHEKFCQEICVSFEFAPGIFYVLGRMLRPNKKRPLCDVAHCCILSRVNSSPSFRPQFY